MTLLKCILLLTLIIGGCDKVSEQESKRKDSGALPTTPATQPAIKTAKTDSRDGNSNLESSQPAPASQPSASGAIAGPGSPQWWLQQAKPSLSQITPPYEREKVAFDLTLDRIWAGDFRAVQDATTLIDEMTSPLLPLERVRLYARLASSQGDAGDLDGAGRSLQLARAFADKIDDARDRSQSENDIDYGLASLALAQSRTGKRALAVSTLTQIRDSDIRDRITNESWEAILLRGVAKPADIEDAIEMAEAARTPESRASALLTVARAMAKAGDTTRAKATADLIPGSGTFPTREYAYEAMAVVTALAGKSEAAKSLFDTALGLAAEMPTFRDRMNLFQSIAISQAKVGDPTSAEDTLSKLQDLYRDAVYPDIAFAYAKLGDTKAVSATIRKIPRGEEKVKAYRWVSHAYKDRGDMTAARQNLAQAQQSIQEVHDERNLRSGWDDIAVLAAELQDLPTAISAAKRTGTGGNWPDYGRVLATYARAGGNSDLIVQTLKSLELTPPERASLCLKAAEHLLNERSR